MVLCYLPIKIIRLFIPLHPPQKLDWESLATHLFLSLDMSGILLKHQHGYVRLLLSLLFQS